MEPELLDSIPKIEDNLETVEETPVEEPYTEGTSESSDAEVEPAELQPKPEESPEELIELVGHPMGGVCPFGVKETFTVYLDESLKRFEHVFPACGSGNSAIKMSMDQLERISKSEAWIDVCKEWQ